MTFKDELTSVLNRACAENRSNTPDFILARYLIGCLNAFDLAVNERTAWYDPKIRAGASQETSPAPDFCDCHCGKCCKGTTTPMGSVCRKLHTLQATLNR